MHFPAFNGGFAQTSEQWFENVHLFWHSQLRSMLGPLLARGDGTSARHRSMCEDSQGTAHAKQTGQTNPQPKLFAKIGVDIIDHVYMYNHVFCYSCTVQYSIYIYIHVCAVIVCTCIYSRCFAGWIWCGIFWSERPEQVGPNN